MDLPEGNWYCSNCTCRICGDLVNALSIDARKCSQCEHKYHETCMNLTDEDRAASDAWFCGPNCQEGLHQTRMQLSLQKHLQKRWISLGNRVYLGNQHATAVR